MAEPNSQPDAGDPRMLATAQQALEQIDAMQSELDAMQDQLAWSNRLSLLGTIAAALAHEYNNLLTPVGSYAQLALAHPDNPELTRKALEAAADGAAKAGRLAHSTLGLASPSQSPNDARCEISEVVDASITCMLPLLKRDQVKTTVQVAPAEVRMDPVALQQVLVNLIRNACIAMQHEPGPRQISIESHENPSKITLQLSDNGPGVPAQVQPRLFEPFVTQPVGNRFATDGAASRAADHASDSTAATEDQPAGSGLGLSICKKLLATVGGRIHHCPSADRGATFRIDLPRVA